MQTVLTDRTMIDGMGKANYGNYRGSINNLVHSLHSINPSAWSDERCSS